MILNKIQLFKYAVFLALGFFAPLHSALPDSISLTTFATGLQRPVWMGEMPGKDGWYLVLEQHEGRIQLYREGPGGALEKTLFLTLAGMATSDETGLLGLAFHPRFAENGLYYLNYNQVSPNTIIEERRAKNDRMTDSGSVRRILTVTQPEANHQGGNLAFGPDGYLYIGMGDGGGGGDNHGAIGNGQNLNTMLGKILRIDVNKPNGTIPYSIPSDNPFIGQAGKLPEIYAYGLRNPWRFSWDRLNGNLWVGDVGQGTREEVTIVKKGENHGWKVMEGKYCHAGNVPNLPTCNDPSFTKPVLDVNRNYGQSITGGYVYRGNASSPWYGAYLFADYASRRLFAIDPAKTDTFEFVYGKGTAISNVSSFAEDHEGRLYMVNLSGTIQRLELGAVSSVSPTHGQYVYPRVKWLGSSKGAIRLQAETKATSTFRVFNVEGRLLDEKTFNSPAEFSLNTGNQSQVVMLQVASEGRTYQQKFSLAH